MNKNNDRFWRLLEPEYKKMISFCMRLTGNKEDADDLFQDSAIKGIKSVNNLKDEDAFKTWFYRIIMNNFKSKMRIKFFKKIVPFTDDNDSIQTTIDLTKHVSAKRKLEFAMSKLNPDERILITLHEIEGYSINELAELIGKKSNAIKVSIFRARQKMKKEIMTGQQKFRNDKAYIKLFEGNNAL